MRERLRARDAVRMALAAGISAAARSGRQRAHGGEGRARSPPVLRQATVGQRHAVVRELPSAIARLQRGRRDSHRLDRPEASSQFHGARQRRLHARRSRGRIPESTPSSSTCCCRCSATSRWRWAPPGTSRRFSLASATTPTYASCSRARFPAQRERVTFDNVAKALASFVRTLISFDSPFDRYAYFGEDAALDASRRCAA